jgi:hypothetical protein
MLFMEDWAKYVSVHEFITDAGLERKYEIMEQGIYE